MPGTLKYGRRHRRVREVFAPMVDGGPCSARADGARRKEIRARWVRGVASPEQSRVRGGRHE
jgi:hypothetical protein